VTTVVHEDRGMGAGGAAALGAAAGFAGGVLLAEAMTPHYGGFGGPTIVGAHRQSACRWPLRDKHWHMLGWHWDEMATHCT
jgi:hypothetical protein